MAGKRIWGWYFYFWAQQPYFTLLLTFVFGPYIATTGREYRFNSGLRFGQDDAPEFARPFLVGPEKLAAMEVSGG